MKRNKLCVTSFGTKDYPIFSLSLLLDQMEITDFHGTAPTITDGEERPGLLDTLSSAHNDFVSEANDLMTTDWTSVISNDKTMFSANTFHPSDSVSQQPYDRHISIPYSHSTNTQSSHNVIGIMTTIWPLSISIAEKVLRTNSFRSSNSVFSTNTISSPPSIVSTNATNNQIENNVNASISLNVTSGYQNYMMYMFSLTLIPVVISIIIIVLIYRKRRNERTRYTHNRLNAMEMASVYRRTTMPPGSNIINSNDSPVNQISDSFDSLPENMYESVESIFYIEDDYLEPNCVLTSLTVPTHPDRISLSPHEYCDNKESTRL